MQNELSYGKFLDFKLALENNLANKLLISQNNSVQKTENYIHLNFSRRLYC
jgi:hypothetical protein